MYSGGNFMFFLLYGSEVNDRFATKVALEKSFVMSLLWFNVFLWMEWSVKRWVVSRFGVLQEQSGGAASLPIAV